MRTIVLALRVWHGLVCALAAALGVLIFLNTKGIAPPNPEVGLRAFGVATVLVAVASLAGVRRLRGRLDGVLAALPFVALLLVPGSPRAAWEFLPGLVLGVWVMAGRWRRE